MVELAKLEESNLPHSSDEVAELDRPLSQQLSILGMVSEHEATSTLQER